MRAVAWAILLAGCSYESPYMRLDPRALPPIPPGMARLIFIRPSGFAAIGGVTLIDEQGHFLGDSMAESHFQALVPIGRHLVVAWAENTDAVDLEVAPGRTYFLEIGMAPGFFSPSTYLHGITPRLSSWSAREEWLRATDGYSPDLASGERYLQTRPRDVAERLRRGREHLRKYRGADLDKHTVRAQDGI